MIIVFILGTPLGRKYSSLYFYFMNIVYIVGMPLGRIYSSLHFNFMIILFIAGMLRSYFYYMIIVNYINSGHAVLMYLLSGSFILSFCTIV